MLRVFAFVALELVLLPITLFGYIVFVAKVILSSKRSGLSVTAYSPLLSRWVLHELGLRDDKVAKKILFTLPSTSSLGLRAVMGPTLLATRLTGYVPAFARYPEPGSERLTNMIMARTEFLDHALKSHLSQMNQVVVLGAGFDTRAYSLLHDENVEVFEVDTLDTQQHKIAALEKENVNASKVKFVTADLDSEDWLKKLQEVGFKSTRSTFFLLEGVTQYLDQVAVEAMLKKIAHSTCKGTIIAFDYFSDGTVDKSSLPFLRYSKLLLRFTGESFKFSVSTAPPAEDHISNFLKAQDLTLTEFRKLGTEFETTQPFGGIVVAAV